MRALDDLARVYYSEDRKSVPDQRKRQERDGNPLRETVIPWIVPIILGGLLVAVGFRLIEGTTPTAPAVLPAAVEQRQVTGGR